MAKKGRIAWCIPYFEKGSGGVNTIFKNAEALWDAGYECDLYILPNVGRSVSEKELRTQISEWFNFTRPFGLHLCATKLEREYELAIATYWDTARFVAASNAKHKAYFIQDWEPSFYPVGDDALTAYSSYKLGLEHITIGAWLSQKCPGPSGAPALSTPFCADRAIYKPLVTEKEQAVCAIFQPEKHRRCSSMLIRSLKIFKELHLDVTIYLYGSVQGASQADFIDLGLLTREECNELYNRCTCGVSMSTTNPSRIPFEMMAAGLPVVDLYGENTLYDLPGEAVVLAYPDAASLATAIGQYFENGELCSAARAAGLKFMSGRNLEVEQSEFVAACEQILSAAPTKVTDPIRKLQDSFVLADSKAIKLEQEVLQKELEAKATECRPYAFSSASLSFTLHTNKDYRLVKLAIWSDPNQVDLQWLEMHPKDEDSRCWTHEAVKLQLELEPKLFLMHLYAVEPEGEREFFVEQIVRNLCQHTVEGDFANEKPMVAEGRAFTVSLESVPEMPESTSPTEKMTFRQKLRGYFGNIF